MVYHFILTRFYLELWTRDKEGTAIDRKEWLHRRLGLFERYCLPAMERQSCRDFEWILLLSAPQNEEDKQLLTEKLDEYQKRCPQIKPVKVKRDFGWQFANIFREVVNDRLKEHGAKDCDLCLTTYMDNDDMLHPDYVREMQKEALSQQYGTFLTYDYGLQYFTELGVATRVSYPNNHFMTLVEGMNDVRTCYGYGSHFLLEKKHVAKVHHIENRQHPMWVEVVHEENVDNDVKMTYNTTLLKADSEMVKPYELEVCNGNRMKFYGRVLKQIVRRTKGKFK